MKFLCLATILLVGCSVDALVAKTGSRWTEGRPLQKILRHGGGDSMESNESGENPVHPPQLSDDERYDKALALLIQAGSDLVGAYPLVSINPFMVNLLNDIYANYNLFGYGMSQAYVREADNNLKGHHMQYHNFEHL